MSVARVTEIKSSKRASRMCANRTLDNVKSAWIQDQEVMVDKKGNIAEYRILMKVTFILKA